MSGVNLGNGSHSLITTLSWGQRGCESDMSSGRLPARAGDISGHSPSSSSFPSIRPQLGGGKNTETSDLSQGLGSRQS